MRGLLIFCLVFAFLSQTAAAVECPPGFTWKRMSGVGCVQSDCGQVGGSYTYEEHCFCRTTRSCYEPVDYTGFDGKKCNPFCPVSRLYACVEPDSKCPHELDQEMAQEAATEGNNYSVKSTKDRNREICTAHCKNQWGLHAVWDGSSEEEHCFCGCEGGYKALTDWISNPKYGYSTHTRCVAEDCKTYCKDLGPAYNYKSGGSGDCVCECADGYVENYPYGFCSSVDENMVFPVNGECHGTAEWDRSEILGDVCSCKLGLGNCDKNNNNGCEVSILRDRLNCGVCGRMCPAKRICYDGFCWDEVFRDVFDLVSSDNKDDIKKLEEVRNGESLDIEKEFLKSSAEFLWGKTADLLEQAVEGGLVESTIAKNTMKAVDYYLDYIKNTQEHLDVRKKVDQLIQDGKIDERQAQVIKNLDAVLRATSVVTEWSGRDIAYAQSAMIDTATQVVVDEAIRASKYRYCADLLEQYDLNTGNPETQKLVDDCLERQQSAGIFK
ncbi:MAG: hypothetical protein V1744_00805 [Candidatus Altiarchaeota archaeon]